MSSTLASPDTDLAGRVHQPGTTGFDSVCAGFDLTAIPTPGMAVSAVEEADVRRFAADHGLPVAVRATGPGPIRGVDHGVLIDARAMSTVTIDPGRRIATAGAGATWTPVLASARRTARPTGLLPGRRRRGLHARRRSRHLIWRVDNHDPTVHRLLRSAEEILTAEA